MRDPVPQPVSALPLQPRAERTRKALIAAAEALAAAGGEAAVTTTSAAGAAGVSVGAVYRYFPDREALLLAAYDASVDAVIHECRAALSELPDAMPSGDAARRLLAIYLGAAASRAGHRELLRAMRRIRPIEADHGPASDRVVTGLLAPFLARYGQRSGAGGERLHFLNVLMGTLVDLYLVTEAADMRQRLHAEIEAHMLLALQRLESS